MTELAKSPKSFFSKCEPDLTSISEVIQQDSSKILTGLYAKFIWLDTMKISLKSDVRLPRYCKFSSGVYFATPPWFFTCGENLVPMSVNILRYSYIIPNDHYTTTAECRHLGLPKVSALCSGSVVVTAYNFESIRLGSNPEWGLIYYEASITAQGLPEPSSFRGSTLGTRAAELKGSSWGMQVDLWLQPCAVFGHSFIGISWHIPQK